MNNLQVTVYERESELPQMECHDFFHSKSLFHVCACSPHMRPYMVAVQGADGSVVAHLLATVRRRSWLWPSMFHAHCSIVGEGDYANATVDREALFALMLQALTKKMQGKALYIEFSHLSQKMFGYRLFRQAGYFPVHWQSIHNSLHSRPPRERLTDKAARRIARAEHRGVVSAEVASDDELRLFVKLLRKHNRLKPKRYIPDVGFFREMAKTANVKLFVTKYRQRVIGCCACVYSGSDAYLWYLASLRKTFVKLHPDTLAVWHAVEWAHAHGYAHISFMDVGLPFHKNPFRDFILQFGGKPVSSYRWFRVSMRWVNSLLSWVYRS